mgnify:FL=1
MPSIAMSPIHLLEWLSKKHPLAFIHNMSIDMHMIKICTLNLHKAVQFKAHQA